MQMARKGQGIGIVEGLQGGFGGVLYHNRNVPTFSPIEVSPGLLFQKAIVGVVICL